MCRLSAAEQPRNFTGGPPDIIRSARDARATNIVGLVLRGKRLLHILREKNNRSKKNTMNAIFVDLLQSSKAQKIHKTIEFLNEMTYLLDNTEK